MATNEKDKSHRSGGRRSHIEIVGTSRWYRHKSNKSNETYVLKSCMVSYGLEIPFDNTRNNINGKLGIIQPDEAYIILLIVLV